jgi:hypothetical protein
MIVRYPSLIGGLVKIRSTTSLKRIALHPYIGFTEVDLVKLRFGKEGQQKSDRVTTLIHSITI